MSCPQAILAFLAKHAPDGISTADMTRHIPALGTVSAAAAHCKWLFDKQLVRREPRKPGSKQYLYFSLGAAQGIAPQPATRPQLPAHQPAAAYGLPDGPDAFRIDWFDDGSITLIIPGQDDVRLSPARAELVAGVCFAHFDVVE